MYSATLTSSVCEKTFWGNVTIRDSMQLMSTTTLLINRRGNSNHIVVGGYLPSSHLALFSLVNA